jgi:hypothetical protein
MMKPKSTDPTADYAKEIARLIQCGKLPSLEQVQAAILSTAAEYKPLIEVARRGEEQLSFSMMRNPSPASSAV